LGLLEAIQLLRFPDQIVRNSILLLLLVSTSGVYSYAVQTAQRREEVGRKALEEGDRLRLEGDEKSLRRALDHYEIARRSFLVVGEKEQYRTSLIKAGDVLASLSRYEESVGQYASALKLTSDEHVKIELLNKLGAACSASGKVQRALEYYRQALLLSQKNSDRNAEARSLTNLGKVSYDRNDIKTALEFLNQSLTIWRSIGDVNAQAETLKYLGYAHTDLSELPTALEYHQQALALCRQVHELHCEAENTNATGLIYALMGEREKAIENYSAAEKVFRSCGDRHGLITALNGRGAVYAAIGSERALDCHQEALRLSREIGDLQGQVVALRFLGTTYRALADRSGSIQNEQTTEQSYNRAVECHNEALKLSQELKDRRIEAYILQELGSVYSSLNRKSEARNFYQRALALSRITSDRRGEAISLDSLGTIAASLKQKDEALSYLRKALTLSQAAGDRPRESATLFHLAHVNLDADQLPEARRLIEAGIEIVESLRTKVVSPDYRADYFASTRDYYELLLEVLTRLNNKRNNKSRQADFAAETFLISEQARARILLDSIRETHLNLREGVDAELLNEERKLGEELDAKAERIAQLKAAGKKDEAAKLGDELRKLTTDYDEVRARIKAKSPRYASLTQPEVVTVSDVQRQLLDADTMVLEYLLSDEHSYLWAITRNDADVFELPGRRSIEQAARAFYELLTKNQPVSGETFDQQQARIVAAQAQLPAAAAALSDIVLRPVADKLGKKRLLIVADGALQYVPFQALMIPAKSGGEYQPLLLDHEVINEPSTSVLALMVGNTLQRRAAPYSVMVYADPVFEARDSRVKAGTAAPPADENKQLQQAFRDIGFEEGSPIPPLPGSREEAEAIISMAPWRSGYQALNFDANRASVNDTDLSQYRVIHFATHGFVDYQHPELSGLVLSMVDEKGNPQDGFLRMHDIYNLKLPVDLVVLSSCNTGLGKEVKGEGLIGLTRGFMYAGARGVVASLWKVDDDATAELMKQFYAGMFQKGLTPAAALREAQLALRSHKRWESPYYWAAFVIQGEYDQKQLGGASKVNIKVVMFGTGILILGSVFLFLWRRRWPPIK